MMDLTKLRFPWDDASDRVLQMAKDWPADDRSPLGEYIREVAQSIRDHRRER